MALIQNIDLWAAGYAESIRSVFLTSFFKTVTYLGEWSIVLAVAIIVALVLITKGKKVYALTLALITFLSIGSVFILKYAIQRPRPIDGIIDETSFSFPSLHAVLSVAFYGLIIYFLWERFKSPRFRFFKILFGLVLVLFIGFSRVYLGVHYLSDVLGGYLLGLFWLTAGIYASFKSGKARP
ncbi:MAG: phosphatase PAP2 family protein [Candidatus Pacebacteria bacterium]|nr:phosphatase PAP2 family protein [Candidatus Paceibacterota bacterium]NUQ57039.1 phosphatase PAP2 family protein [Candidatus Paceibacter sp.]